MSEGSQDISRKSSDCKIYVVLNRNIEMKIDTDRLYLLVARGLPRDTENILVYWKNFTSGLSFTVSILGQHFWSALGSTFDTSSNRHQGG